MERLASIRIGSPMALWCSVNPLPCAGTLPQRLVGYRGHWSAAKSLAPLLDIATVYFVPFCALWQFPLEVICGMLSVDERWHKESGRDDGGELQGGPFSAGHHFHRCARVCGVSLELPAGRRTPGGARGGGGSCHHPALDGEVQSPIAP